MASARSAGSKITYDGTEVTVEDLAVASFEDVDFALFSAGGGTAKQYAPIAAEQGATVIDNSSAFRYDDEYPLVVPEVNPEAVRNHPGIIANPNCSTIQLVVALKPLQDVVGIERIIVSTYQSSSGAGQKGMWELWNGVKARVNDEQEPAPSTFPHPLAFDVIPHIDVFGENGYTKEEMKMTWETRKIMGLPELQVSATCVRVPVLRGHSEAVTLDLAAPLSAADAKQILSEAPGVKLWDDPQTNTYPLARLCEGNDHTWVGRVRNDNERPNTLHLWVVSDNLRKGAALNAVQIAELLIND
jgi:aspartate-semialdehyde dehydrogenase